MCSKLDLDTRVQNEEFIKGTLKRIIYYNEENAYTVGNFIISDTKKNVTVTGVLPGVKCGEFLHLKGAWCNHSSYGKQFKFESFESHLPSDIYGIRQYLGSGLINGIGKVYANNIVDHFKEETFYVLSNESARLTEVPGIGKKRANLIKSSWNEQMSIREVMIFLKTYGFSTSQCLRLYKHYGEETCNFIKSNPYRIISDIDGIGFKSADKIALNLGFANDSVFRIESGIEYVISEFESEGHTCCEKETLLKSLSNLLQIDYNKGQETLEKLLEEGNRVAEWNTKIQRTKMAIKEASVAKQVRRLNEHPSSLPPIQIEKAIDWTEAKFKINWAKEQKEALINVLSSKLSILTGGPGTGKTTLLLALVEILKAKKVRLGLAAPTGRAAQRMTEATGIDAKTIHRALKFEPSIGRFLFNKENQFPVDFLIIDESSMLDVPLAASLLEAIPNAAHVLFVGDIHQLPSVGPGNVLRDFINSKKFKVTELKSVFRQSSRSSIVSIAHDILSGKSQLPIQFAKDYHEINPENDLNFILAENANDCVEQVEKLCCEHLPKLYGINPVTDLQVLVPMHKGTAGIEVFNKNFQNRLIPHSSRALDLAGQKFHPCDKVMQLRNNYEKNIFNGDFGYIDEVYEEKMIVRFANELFEFGKMDAIDLKLAYAVSIHKSQGSEFPIVVIPLLKQHFILLKRNLIYTAITRGRKKVFIVGDPKAYSMAVRIPDSSVRLTSLRERLAGV